LDRAAEKLRQAGLTRVLLDFGGQMLALDPPRGQAGWTVTPASGVADGQPFTLAHGSVAVSGDDERGLRIDGQRISHILDPRTGTPVEPRAPVLIWARSALDADAWSTALYIMGPAAIPLLEARGHRAQQPRP
jgi:thiamine biosynthesis lipoprotein